MDHLVVLPTMGDKPNKKRIFAGIIVALLVLAIPLGVYLVRQTQIFKPKAGGGVEPPVTKFFLSGPEADFLCVYTSPCPPVAIENITPGTEFKINVLVKSDFDPANHFLANLMFPTDLLEVVRIDAPVSTAPPPAPSPRASASVQATQAPSPSPRSSAGTQVSPSPSSSPAPTPPPVTSTNPNVPQVSNVVSTSVDCQSGGGIKITWTNPSGILFHRIDKTADGTNWVFAGFTDGSLTPPASQFIDKSGTPGAFYAYRVYAAGNSANPGYSNPVVQTQTNWVPLPICSAANFLNLPNLIKAASAQSTINPVTNVFSTALDCQAGKSPIKITWTNPQFVTFHRIERTSDNTTWSTVGFTDGNVSPAATSFTDLSPLPNTFYAYRVFAAGDSSHPGFAQAGVQTNQTWPLSKVCTIASASPTASPTDSPITSPIPSPREQSNVLTYFINQWVDKSFDNDTGKINLDGTVLDPGLKTDPEGTPVYGLMATIVFKAKAVGSATIAYSNESHIFRLSDNQDILGTKDPVTIVISAVNASSSPGSSSSPASSSSPGSSSSPASSSSPTASASTTPGKGDGNKDGKIDFVDLSILLSFYLRAKTELDFNSDGIINGLDYSAMLQLLRQKGIIRQNN